MGLHVQSVICIDNKDGKLSGHKRKRSMNSENDTPSKRQRNGENHMYQNPKVFTEEALANLKIYNELKTEYEEEGVNQKTHQFLSRISHGKINECPELTKVPLMQHISNACKTMMLSEFEIAAWGSWLDTMDIKKTAGYTTEDLLLFTAFCLKMALNDEDYLNSMFQSFFN
jgi:hypothetical protein